MRAGRSNAFAAALLLFAVACPRQRSVDDLLADPLVRADRAWAERGTEGLEPVDAALAEAEAISRSHPDVAWRRVRLGIAQGYTHDGVERLRDWSAARDAGIACLLPRAEGQGPGDPGALLRSVSTAQAPCVAWTLLAWARWMQAFGPEAAALDLRRLDAALAWSAARPRLGGPHDDVAAWAEGIIAAVRPPAEGRDYALAEERLRAVAKDHPDEAIVLLDLYELVAVPLGDETLTRELVESLEQSDLDSPEERAMIGRWREAAPTP